MRSLTGNDFESTNIALCPIELYAVSALFRVPINRVYSTAMLSFVLPLVWLRSYAVHRLRCISLHRWDRHALDRDNSPQPDDDSDCPVGFEPLSSECPDFAYSLRDSQSIARSRPTVLDTENHRDESNWWPFRCELQMRLPPSTPFQVWYEHRPSLLCVGWMHAPHCRL